jgi:hypothetical protein
VLLLCVCVTFFFLSSFFYSCIINFIITILLSLLLSSSLSLLLLYYNPLFSLPTTLFAHSLPLFPCLHLTFPPFSNLSPHYRSLLHTHHLLLAYCTNCIQPQPPTIPDKNTLHYNNKNTPKNTQGSQNLATPTTLKPPTHSFPHHPFFSDTFINSPQSIIT